MQSKKQITSVVLLKTFSQYMYINKVRLSTAKYRAVSPFYALSKMCGKNKDDALKMHIRF